MKVNFTSLIFYSIFLIFLFKFVIREESYDLFSPHHKDASVKKGILRDGYGKHIYFARKPRGTILKTLQRLYRLNDYYLKTVKWRSILLGSVIAVVFISISLLKRVPTISEFVTMILCILLTFFGISSYYHYHYHSHANEYGKRNLEYLKKKLSHII